jgi:hypothetical protein
MLAALIGARTGTGTLATTANISSLLQAALLGRGGKLRIDRTAALLFLAPAEHHVPVLYGWMMDVTSIGRTATLPNSSCRWIRS